MSVINKVLKFTQKIPEPVWAPISITVILSIPGALAIIFSQPWLFPSLGPTAYLQSHKVKDRSTKLYNVLMGNYLAIAAGYAGLFIYEAQNSPGLFTSGILTGERFFASITATFFMSIAHQLMKISEPSAAATLLLITLGSFKPVEKDFLALFVEITVVGIFGELIRYLRIGKVS